MVDVLQGALQAVNNLDRTQIGLVLAHLRTTRAEKGRLFCIGNGGGAGHASHAAADFRKLARIETYAWGDNVSDLTAYTNDHGWASATASWLDDSDCGRDDAILVFSVGGGSRDTSVNLKEAIFWAKGGPTILGIVGAAGGYTAQHADATIVIPSFSTPIIEGVQAVVWHHIVNELAAS